MVNIPFISYTTKNTYTKSNWKNELKKIWNQGNINKIDFLLTQVNSSQIPTPYYNKLLYPINYLYVMVCGV